MEELFDSKIKFIRVRIDSLAQLTERLGDPNLSRQLQMATDKLFFGKAWLGKLLGEIGVYSPYPNDGSRKTVADIEPTADHTKEVNVPASFTDGSQVEKVDFIRQEIGEMCSVVFDIKAGGAMLSHKGDIFTTESYTALCEARFWLGFELERIRNNS